MEETHYITKSKRPKLYRTHLGQVVYQLVHYQVLPESHIIDIEKHSRYRPIRVLRAITRRGIWDDGGIGMSSIDSMLSKPYSGSLCIRFPTRSSSGGDSWVLSSAEQVCCRIYCHITNIRTMISRGCQSSRICIWWCRHQHNLRWHRVMLQQRHVTRNRVMMMWIQNQLFPKIPFGENMACCRS